MARKVILDTYYSFTPSTRTIVIPRAIPKERLMLITDVTTNQVIFNFSDPNLTTTSYVVGPDTTGVYAQATTTTITLSYNTTNLSATDKLQIVVDEYDEKFTPSETYLDPINKLRVSTPQSLIDTDYEYSIQTTKWEQLGMINNIPYAYYVTATGNLSLADLRANPGSRSYTAYMSSTVALAPAVGTPVVVLDAVWNGADGLYIVDSNNNLTLTNTTGTPNTFSYTGKFAFTGSTANTTILNPGVTISYSGNTFSNTAISMTSVVASSGNLITVTANNHGLVVGNEIGLTGTSGGSAANGSFTVTGTPSQNVFTFYTTGVTYVTPGTATITGANLYVRPQGLAYHRAFDGGVRFSTNAASHNQQYVRQTRRYFRYQSGKGIQMSTGTTLCTQLNLDGITYSGGVATVTTKDPHNIAGGVTISISGANETAYNGSYVIQNVITPYSFTYIPSSAPVNTQASGAIYGSVTNWNGSSTRIGIFDSQNGLFWQYDGQTLSAVRRSSVYQIAGQVVVTPNSNYVTGSSLFPTYFSKQLSVGDFIVLKGMSYRVTSISSDTLMTVSPAYRGANQANNVVCSKTIDYVIPSSQFNVDRLDGTGPSGYKIDLSRMQMLYIDYSWYGAGFIRFGVRGSDGNVIYCHRIVNNNQNYLAYMRSGNLPGRYETNTFAKTTYMLGGASGIGTNFLSTDPILYANNISSGWPTSGTLRISSANTAGVGSGNSVIEYVNYSSLSGNSFVISTRGQAGLTTTGLILAGNNYITSLVSTSGVQLGQYIVGLGIPSQSYVTNIPNSTTVIMSQAATSSVSGGTIVFAPLGNTATTFAYSNTAQTSIDLHSPVFGPEINHWGTSAIMDGGFTPDKSFIFTKGMTNNINVASGATQAIMSFRIAPSASNGIGASQLGVREIINRLQHLPFETDMYSNGSFLITAVLNGTSSNTAEQWQAVGGSSLSQYIFHTQGTTLSGGESVFGFYLNTQGSSGLYATTQQDLTQLLAIGNSIIGGGFANAATGIYPNGPDVITFIGQNIQTGANAATIQARYSWNEAQA